MGEAVKDPNPRSGDGTDGYYSKCNYYSVKRGKSLIIRLQLPGPSAIGPEKELQLLIAANGAMEKVSGIGDSAQMFTGGGDSGFASRVLMLYVAKGNAFLTIGVGGFADERFNDEDRFTTNKSGDPRIGTHRRKYEPGE